MYDVTKDQDDASKKLLTLFHVDDFYPQDTWIRIYRDGSATHTIQDGGEGSILYLTNENTIKSATVTRKHCTNHAAEVKAFKQEAKAKVDIEENHTEDVVSLKNSKSV